MAKPAIRQVKGPGMNLGLKKPRKGYIPKPKPYKPSKEAKAAMATESGSYLPGGQRGKPKKGKSPSYL